CSPVHTDSNPTSSAARTTRAWTSGSAQLPKLTPKRPKRMQPVLLPLGELRANRYLVVRTDAAERRGGTGGERRGAGTAPAAGAGGLAARGSGGARGGGAARGGARRGGRRAWAAGDGHRGRELLVEPARHRGDGARDRCGHGCAPARVDPPAAAPRRVY